MIKKIELTKNEPLTEKTGSKNLEEVLRIVDTIQKKMQRVANKSDNASAAY